MNVKNELMRRAWMRVAIVCVVVIFSLGSFASAQVITRTKTVVKKGAVKTAHGTRTGYRVTKRTTIVGARKTNRGLHKGWYLGRRVGKRSWRTTRRVSHKGWRGTKRVTVRTVKRVR